MLLPDDAASIPVKSLPDTWEYRYDLRGQEKIENRKHDYYLRKLGEIKEKMSDREMQIVNKVLRGEDTTQERLELLLTKMEEIQPNSSELSSSIELFVVYFHLYEKARDMAFAIRQKI